MFPFLLYFYHLFLMDVASVRLVWTEVFTLILN